MWHRIGTKAMFLGSSGEEITPCACSSFHANVVRWLYEHKNRESCAFYKWKSHYIWGESGKKAKEKVSILGSEHSWGALDACQRDTTVGVLHGWQPPAHRVQHPAYCLTVLLVLFRKVIRNGTKYDSISESVK